MYAYIHTHTHTYIVYGLESSPSRGQSFCHCGTLDRILNWCKLLWLHVWSDASSKEVEWLNSTGQQVMRDTDVLPDCSTWKGLTSMNNIRATGIYWFKKRVGRQNTFKLHTHTNGFWVIFDFFEVQSSLKVHETVHTNFKWGVFFLGQKKRKTKRKKHQNIVLYSYTIALKQTHFIKWKPF